MPNLVLAGILALLAAATPAGAVTYYVRAGGDDGQDGLTPSTALASIRLAATRLSAPGDRLVVGPGTYAAGNIEPLVSGTPDAPIVLYADRDGALTGDPAGPVTIVPPNTIDATTGIIVYGRQDVVIDGFTVVGAADAGVQIRRRRGLPIDSSRIVLRHLVISDGARRGIDVHVTGDVAILDNQVRRCGGAGIAVTGGEGGAARPRVERNISEDNEAALSLAATFAAVVRDNVLGNGRIGLHVVGSRDLTIADNELIGRDRGVTLSGVDGATVTGNAIFRKGDLRISGALVMEGNTFPDDFSPELGIGVYPEGSVSLIGNALPRTTVYGPAVVEIVGNTTQRLRVWADRVAVRDSRIGGHGLEVHADGALEIRNVETAAIDASGATVVATDNTVAGIARLAGRVAEVSGNTAGHIAFAWRPDTPSDGVSAEEAVVVRDNRVATVLRIGSDHFAIPAGTVAANVIGDALDVFASGPLAIVDNTAARLIAELSGPNTPVRITGNTLRDSADSGLRLNGASAALVADNVATGHADRALVARKVAALTVRGNVFSDNGVGGITVLAAPLPSDCNGDTLVSIADLITIVGLLLGERPLDDCRVADRDGDGAISIGETVAAVATALGSDAPAPAGTLVLDGNTVEHNGRRGIDVVAPGAVVATGNRVLHNGGIALAVRTQDPRHPVTVVGNVLGGSTAEGLHVARSAVVRIAGNRIFDNRDGGIVLNDTPDALVQNNLVYANGTHGIGIGLSDGPAPGTRVVNNTLYGNDGLAVAIGRSGAPSPGVVLLDNIITGNRRGGIAASADSLDGLEIGFNLVNDEYGTDIVPSVTNFTADPRFNDPDGADDILGGSGWADDDFRLRADPPSAAIDAGSATAAELGLTGSAVVGLDGDPGVVDLGFHVPPG